MDDWFSAEQIAAMAHRPEAVAARILEPAEHHPLAVELIRRIGIALEAAGPEARLAMETRGRRAGQLAIVQAPAPAPKEDSNGHVAHLDAP